MCLSTLYSERTRDRWRAKAKEKGYLRLYKVVRKRGNSYYPEFCRSGVAFCNALNISLTLQGTRYGLYFHCFASRQKAQWWAHFQKEKEVIECFVAPEWISCVGMDWGKTLVCRKIFMPTYPSKRPRVRDFQAALKKDRASNH